MIDTGYTPEYARAALDYEVVLRRADPGDAERVAALRDEGLAIARELGMRALEERVLGALVRIVAIG